MAIHCRRRLRTCLSSEPAVFFFVCAAVAIFIYVRISFKERNFFYVEVFPPQTSPVKLVYLYTKWFGTRPWPFMDFESCLPEVAERCRVTYSRFDLLKSDAVMAHAWSFDMPSPDRIRADRSLVERPEQIWIYHTQEPPPFANAEEFDGLFNWTSSYRLESDIHVPYSDVVKLHIPNLSASIVNYAKGKDKQVLIKISNCNGIRVKFIQALIKEGIEVNVFGGCAKIFGNKYFPPEFFEHKPDCNGPCQLWQQSHKFYLAMENNFCEGYVTEKYYHHGLLSGLVPIVIGGANYSDSRIAPPGSYVHAGRFNNVKELANYIRYLDANDTAYNEYFTWKKQYSLRSRNILCSVCSALWKPENDPRVKRKVVDLKQFWGRDTTCFNVSEVEDVFTFMKSRVRAEP